MPDVDLRTLLVQDRSGVFKVTVPASWKVTFSAFMPGHGGGPRDLGPSLRIYEGRDKQRACFTNVVAFRDLSMPMERARMVDGEPVWETDDKISPEPGTQKRRVELEEIADEMEDLMSDDPSAPF